MCLPPPSLSPMEPSPPPSTGWQLPSGWIRSTDLPRAPSDRRVWNRGGPRPGVARAWRRATQARGGTRRSSPRPTPARRPSDRFLPPLPHSSFLRTDGPTFGIDSPAPRRTTGGRNGGSRGARGRRLLRRTRGGEFRTDCRGGDPLLPTCCGDLPDRTHQRQRGGSPPGYLLGEEVSSTRPLARRCGFRSQRGLERQRRTPLPRLLMAELHTTKSD
mmetsp:Transcript_28295/g.83292  ORF Transcript_28295/g.83292 Transcript_28295/m.83292 type:complete len:216 (+) Transcript_28295:2624-3271(+)